MLGVLSPENLEFAGFVGWARGLKNKIGRVTSVDRTFIVDEENMHF
jgi:hypothetical protein